MITTPLTGLWSGPMVMVPDTPGKSLIAAAAPGPDLTDDQEQIIKDRLSGLGYI